MDGPIRQAPLSLTEGAITPEPELAAAVFQRADDACHTHVPARQRAARIFLLADTSSFDFWAAELGLGPRQGQ